MRYLLIVFLCLSSGSVLAASMSKRRFEEVLPVTAMSIIVLLYVAALFNILLTGFYFVVFLCFGCYVVAVIFIIRKKGFKDFLSRLVTPGSVIFCILFIILCLGLRGRMVMFWDELRLWGALPKLLFYKNALQLGPSSQLYPTMQSYPPGMALFQYFGAVSAGKFVEADLFRSYTIFCLALFIPATKNMKWRNFPAIPVVGFAILILPLMFYNSNFDNNNYYLSLYIDAALGITFGYCIYLCFIDKLKGFFYFIRIGLSLFVLVLLKDTGMYLAVFVAVVMLIFQLYDKKLKETSTERTKKYKYFLISGGQFLAVLCTPIIAELSWKAYLGKYHVSNIFPNVFTQLSKDLTSQQIELIHIFFIAFCKQPIISTPFSVSSLFVLCIFILCSVFIILSASSSKRKRLGIIAVLMPIFAVLFTVGLVCLYLFDFGISDGMQLPSYPRYISEFWMGYAVVIFAEFLYVIYDHRDDTKHMNSMLKCVVSIFSVIALVITPLSAMGGLNSFAAYASADEQKTRNLQSKYIFDIANGVEDKSKTNNVYLVIEGNGIDDTLLHHMIYFSLIGTPVFIKNFCDTINVTAPVNSTNEEKQKIMEQWRNELEKDFDYVYLLNIDDAFFQQDSQLFGDYTAIKLATLYKVNRSGQEPLLTPVK